jgi:hypothetical protein
MELSLFLYPCYCSFWEFFISTMLILQMAHTSNRNNNNAENNNGENNKDVNPSSPPPPSLEQVLAVQAQMLQTMQQTMVNMQATQLQVPPPLPRDRLGDVQCTKPLTLSHAVEPMDADD